MTYPQTPPQARYMPPGEPGNANLLHSGGSQRASVATSEGLSKYRLLVLVRFDVFLRVDYIINLMDFLRDPERFLKESV